MKKVLHRSFKPAKCKISLQMAASRLKILKNKKDTQIKQLRRELAQLLESGQTQTAKIRVEHVVREEKTVAAYELVSIYCELIVARLGVIESQKSCPHDLKEAVASVLYASQRLSDVSELSDVVKHFTAKYGKDFVSAAIGLQPDSGVSRLLVEKLSVKAPDGPTKIKILKEIATEHNVNWEAESMVESDPKENVLLTGATSSQPTVGINSDSSRIPNNQSPDFQSPATVNVSQNPYVIDGRSSSRTTSTDFNIGKTADHYHQDPGPSGDRTESREHRHPNPGHGDSSPWEMEFVDATTAARAAAESAERASFGARAAAELSSKERMMMMQNPTELRNSNNPPHGGSSTPNVQSGDFAKEEMLRSSNKKEDKSTSRPESVDELSENTSWRRGHSRENSLEMRLNDSLSRLGREKDQPSMDDKNLSNSENVLLKKQSSQASPHSQSSNFSDDNYVPALGHIDSPSILEENRFHSTLKDTGSHNHSPDAVDAPTFDDYSSFFDKPQFDTEDTYRDEPEQGLGFSFLGSSSKTPDHMPAETNSWIFEGHKSLGQSSSTSTSTSQILEKEKRSSPIFDDGPTSPPASLHEAEPSAKFDDYDQNSESEEDKGKIFGRVEETPKLESHKSTVSENPDDLGRYFFPSDTEDQEDDYRIQEESDTETPKDLKFGPLGGGLKNEETLTQYGTSPPRDKMSSISVTEHVPTAVDQSRSSSLQTVSSSSVRKDLYSQKASNTDKRPSSLPPDSSSSDDDPEMELPERVYDRNQDKRTESRTLTTHLHSRVSHEDSGEEILTRASTRSQESRAHKTTPASSASYLLSVSGDDEDEKEVRRDDPRIQTKPNISRLSRRTKGQERRSSPVLATDKVSHDQESTPKLIPETKPLAKQQESASSSSLPKTVNVSHVQEYVPKLTPETKPSAKQQESTSSSSSLPKTVNVSHVQESVPKLTPETKPSAKQQGSTSSSSSLPKTDNASHVQESPPKLIPKAKPMAKQQGSDSSYSYFPKTNKVSHDQASPPKLHPKAKPAAKQQGSDSSYSSFPKTNKVSHDQASPPEIFPEAKSLLKQEDLASSSSSLPKTMASPDPQTPAKEKASHVHPKLPDYDDIFAKLGALRR